MTAERVDRTLLDQARRTIGVTGDGRNVGSGVDAARAAGVGLYPVVALGLLVVTYDFRQTAALVFAPEISDDVGLSRTTLGAIVALTTTSAAVATFVVADLVQRLGRRVPVVLGSALLWCSCTALTAGVRNGWQLAVVAVLYAVAGASIATLHAPLVVDAYPPLVRARMLSAHHGARAAANVVAPLLVALLTSALGLTWRGVLLVLGALAFALVLPAMRLREPHQGRWDVEPVRRLVDADSVAAAPPRASLAEAWHQLMSVPTVRRILYASVGVGMTFIPLGTYLLFFLRDEWGLEPDQRSLLFAAAAGVATVGLLMFAPVAERLFRSDPRRLLRVSAALFAAGVTAVAVAVLAPVLAVAAAGVALGLSAITMSAPGLQLVALSVIPPHLRPHYAAIAGVFVSAVGGVAGLVVLRMIDDQLGLRASIASLTMPALFAALVAARAADTLPGDLDRLLAEVLDDERARQRRKQRRCSLLECSGIQVSYTGSPVLRGVDLTVEAGEVVALLGSNGTGKTTLLHCLSGLRFPDAGAVRLHGKTVTYLPAEKRVRRGIVQLPGSGATFGPLSVRDNLHLASRAAGNRRDVEGALERLPQLVPLLDRPAASLSGGEQRLVGLARALVLRPRLLLVDELSWGLSPALVARSVELLHELRDQGVGVVVVDQSVELATTVASRAYVLDDGVVAFSGSTNDLRSRPDLVRARFLTPADTSPAS